MKQSLRIKQRQGLVFNTRFGNSVRMLQMPVSQLNQELRDSLESNPLLEESDSTTLTETRSESERVLDVDSRVDKEMPDHFVVTQEHSAIEGDWLEALNAENQHVTIRDHVQSQLTFVGLGEIQREIARVVVSSIDERGYITSSHAEVMGVLSHLPNLCEQQIEQVINLIQECDPAGVGARDLGECLKLQIAASEVAKDIAATAWQIVDSCMDDLASGALQVIAENLAVEDSMILAAVDLIRNLNPSPGNGFGEAVAALVPDVVVSKIQGHWHVKLNDEFLPKLRISREYRSMIVPNSRSEGNRYLANCLNEANLMLDNLKRRRSTLLSVALQIVQHQEKFLEKGEQYMRPLTLSEVADVVNLHESTVSRACAGKFMATPRGTFPFKYFFPPRLTDDVGDDQSSLAVKQRIATLISNENHLSPMSDQQLSDQLLIDGLHVARRTIAKYRTGLGIPTKRERKLRGYSQSTGG